jgi:hypothetical protein
MKKLILIALLIASVPGLALGQAGVIALWGNDSYTQCEIVDGAPGLITVYVVHQYTSGAKGSWFMVHAGSGANLTYLQMSSDYTTYGDPHSGICVEYGECLTGPIRVLTINYFGSGISSACSRLEVVPDPAAPSGTVAVLDCEDNYLVGSRGVLIINNDGGGPCHVAVINDAIDGLSGTKTHEQKYINANFCPEPPSPVIYDSWGHIKALYN